MYSKNDDFNSFQKINISKLFSFKCIRKQRGTCIKRLFWPPYEVKKIKVALYKFLLISLLGQKPKCKGLVLIRLLQLPW